MSRFRVQRRVLTAVLSIGLVASGFVASDSALATVTTSESGSKHVAWADAAVK